MKISSTGLNGKKECLRLRNSMRCRSLERLTCSYRRYWMNLTVLLLCSSIIVLKKQRRNELLLKKWKKSSNHHFSMNLKLTYQNNLLCSLLKNLNNLPDRNFQLMISWHMKLYVHWRITLIVINMPFFRIWLQSLVNSNDWKLMNLRIKGFSLKLWWSNNKSNSKSFRTSSSKCHLLNKPLSLYLNDFHLLSKRV